MLQDSRDRSKVPPTIDIEDLRHGFLELPGVLMAVLGRGIILLSVEVDPAVHHMVTPVAPADVHILSFY